MNINIDTAQYLEELLEVNTARIHCYKELLSFTEDQFCRIILTRYIIQSEMFIEEILNATYQVSPFQFKKTMITISFKTSYSYSFLNNNNWRQIEIFQFCEEIEKITIEWYESILEDIIPVPLNIIVSQQLKDAKISYQKILFLKHTLNKSTLA